MADTFAGRKVLITGGLGFIGSNLAHRLVALGAHVTILDSLHKDHGGNYANLAGIEDRITITLADARDSAAMNTAIQGIDYLFNCVGQVSHIDSMTDPLTDLEINTRAQLVIAESVRHHNPEVRVLHLATRQQYGRPQRLPVDETHPLAPVDVNGIHKIAGETYFLLYHAIYGLRVTSIRLSNTYGPRQLIAHNRQGFIAWFVRNNLLGNSIQLFGDGRQLRDMCYVGDAIEAMIAAACADHAIGQVYNVGGMRPYSLKEIVEMMIAITGRGAYEIVPFPSTLKAIDIGDFYTDHTKITRELGWEPLIDLREGMTQTLAFYEQHKAAYLPELFATAGQS
ncbi:MAG: SDR family NAD(P)-dependent oxidoreductase [Anaerolineae bacterium]|jgi:UDP-glucose 4-epimerase|nr:SDR family NAD(P)-dependent oxidoreductase [Anaerolineae bacterium]